MDIFSTREIDVLGIIGRKKLTVRKITGMYYSEYMVIPFNSEILIHNTIRNIRNKCNYHKLDWTLNKIKKDGNLVIFKNRRSK